MSEEPLERRVCPMETLPAVGATCSVRTWAANPVVVVRKLSDSGNVTKPGPFSEKALGDALFHGTDVCGGPGILRHCSVLGGWRCLDVFGGSGGSAEQRGGC